MRKYTRDFLGKNDETDKKRKHNRSRRKRQKIFKGKLFRARRNRKLRYARIAHTFLYRRAYLHAHDKFRRKDVRDKYYHLSFGNHGIHDIDDLSRRSGHREKVLLAQGRSFRRAVSCYRLQLRGVFIVVESRL